MNWNTINWRIWLSRVLVFASIVLMIVSFTMPWWTAVFTGQHGVVTTVSAGTINIYGWGLRHNLIQLASYVQADVTPFYQTVLAWIYLGMSAGLAILSTWLRGIKGTLLLGGIGLIYIIYVIIAVFNVISNRVEDFSIPLQGATAKFVEQNFVFIETSLQPGYYLVYAAGGLLILLALLRFIIIDKTHK